MGKSLRTVSTSNMIRSSRKLHAYFIAFDCHRIRPHRHHRRERPHLARLYVEAGAVSRTLDQVAGQRALAQRPAVVRTDVVDGVELATDVCQCDAAVAYFEHAH